MNSTALSRPNTVAWRSVLPYLALLAAMTIIPAGTSYAKQLFPIVGAPGTSAYRVGFSALLLMLVWRPWRRQWSRRDLGTIALYGGAIGLMNLSFYMSLRTLPLGVALAIEFLGPLSVALYHSRRLSHLVWVGLVLVGLALLLPLQSGSASLDPVGVAFALSAALFWGLYIVFGQRASHIHPGDTVAIGLTVASLIVVPTGLATAGMQLFTPSLMLIGFIAAVLSCAIPFSLEMYALRSVPKRTFGVMVAGEPAMGAIIGAIILSEALSLTQWGAIMCIVAAGAGSVLTSAAGKAAAQPDPAE